MNIEFNSNIETINWQRASELFYSVGWGIRNPEEIQSAFEKSSFVRFAYSNNVLVGFGRTVDDGKYYAFTTLTSAVGKEAFYEKQGWKKQVTSFIWPRSEKQRKENT